MRDDAEHEPDTDVRPGARVWIQHGQRGMEPGLRLRHGHRRRLVRCAGWRRRISGRVRIHRAGNSLRLRAKPGDESALARTSTTVRSGQMVIEFAGVQIAVDINCELLKGYPSLVKSVTVCAWMLTVCTIPHGRCMRVGAISTPDPPPD